jgi:hypothetical protein
MQGAGAAAAAWLSPEICHSTRHARTLRAQQSWTAQNGGNCNSWLSRNNSLLIFLLYLEI